MLFDAHRVIGKILYQENKKTHPYFPNLNTFQYGCVLPDLSPRLKTLPHFHWESMDLVWMMIERLWNRSVPQSEAQDKDYARHLGVIVHYLADYFCSAHTDPKYRRNARHLVYEFRVSLFLHRSKREMRRSYQEHAPALYLTAAGLKKYLHAIYQEYRHQPEHPMMDIEYTLKACLAVTGSLLAAAQCNSLAASAA